MSPTLSLIVAAAVSLAIGWAAWFYGYKKTLNEKQIRFRARRGNIGRS